MSGSSTANVSRSRFRVIPVVAAAAALLVGIGALANWYAGHVALPRYCENPQQTLMLLERVITAPEPAGSEPRRDYLVAAKLLFLLPRGGDEPADAYLQRVRRFLGRQC